MLQTWLLKAKKECMANWNGQTPSEILLWVLIAILTFIVSWRIFGFWIALLILSVILTGRFYNVTVTGFLTVFGIFVAINQLSIQTKEIKTAAEQNELDKRPYLFVEFGYDARMRSNDFLFGGLFYFYNRGRLPASSIETNYLVCSETKCIDFKKWYADSYGGFPDIRFVAPEGNVGPLVYTPGIPKDSKCVCVGVSLSYSGIDARKYWFRRLNTFRIISNGDKKELKLISTEVDWDRNGKSIIPELKQPDWSKYSSCKA